MNSGFDFSAPVWNTSAIMRRAWAWAKADRDFHSAYDWTTGVGYGRPIPVPAAERRAIFAKYLARAWEAAKARVQTDEAAWITRNDPTAHGLQVAIDELRWQLSSFGLEQKLDGLRQRLEARVEEVRLQMAQKRAITRKAALIVSAGNRVIRVTFTKKDGARRVMRINPAELRNHLKGRDACQSAQKASQTRKERHPHLMPVWDVEAQGARSVNLLTVSRIAIGERVHRFAA